MMSTLLRKCLLLKYFLPRWATYALLYDRHFENGYDKEEDIPAGYRRFRYVDVGNSGYEDGTKDNPYNTVNEGINAAPDKYTVLVAVGIYEEGVTIDKDIRLIGESPTTTIIDAGDATGSGLLMG